MPATKNYRKRRNPEGEENDQNTPSDDEEQSRQPTFSFFLSFLAFGGFDFDFSFGFVRLALEEVKFLQKQRERKSGIPAIPTVQVLVGGLVPKAGEKNEGGDGEKDDLVLQDTFAQETAVTIEDPNM